MKKDLERKGKKTLCFNLDRLEDLENFKTQKTLLEKIKFEFGDEKVYVFIDEIQRLSNAGFFLKGLYDYLSPYKFIVTGSGSLELRQNIVEPLTGRKKLFIFILCLLKNFFSLRQEKKLISLIAFIILIKTKQKGF
mgnify:CR=1 FL=1